MNMIFTGKHIGLVLPHQNEAAGVGPRFTQTAEGFEKFLSEEWAAHSQLIRKLPHTGMPH